MTATQQTSADQLLSISEAATRLGYTYRHVRRLIQSGDLLGSAIGQTRRGTAWRVSEDALATFIEARTVGGNPPAPKTAPRNAAPLDKVKQRRYRAFLKSLSPTTGSGA